MRFAIIVSIIFLSLLVACNGTPDSQNIEPSPSPEAVETIPPISGLPKDPTPEPATPGISEEEMATYLWDKLPDKLQDGYTKDDFLPDTKKATRLDNEKWEFQLSGSENESMILPQQCLEKTPGEWVLNNSREVKYFNLVLTADYYENTDTLDVLSIEKTETETILETIHEKPTLGRGLKVSWIQGSSTGGNGLRIEGVVKNIGCATLENAIVEVATFSVEGDLIRIDQTELVPNILNADESAKFALDIQQSLKGSESGEHGEYIMGKYAYRFLMPSGEVIYVEE